MKIGKEDPVSSYTYVLLDPRYPGYYRYGRWVFHYLPFYVGKGKRGRCFVHEHSALKSSRSTPKLNKIRKILASGLSVRIRVVRRNLTDSEARELEIALIGRIGRLEGLSNERKGPLVNLTIGGDGHKGFIKTPELRQKISEASRLAWECKSLSQKNKSVSNLFNRDWRNDPVRQAEASRKISQAVVAIHQARTAKERKALNLKKQKGQLAYYASRTLEQKAAASEARRRSWITRRATQQI